MLEPMAVIIADLECLILALDCPFSDILRLIAKLVGDGGDSKCAEDPVVHIPTNLVSDKVVRISIVLVAIWPLSIISNLLKDRKSSRASLLDVVFGAPVVRIYPHVAQRVEVWNELYLLLMLRNELSQSLCLWLWEGTRASVALAAWVCAIILELCLLITKDLSEGLGSFGDKANLGLLGNSPVDSIVPIQIDTGVFIGTGIPLGAIGSLWAHILSLLDYLTSFFKLFLHQSCSVHIHNWEDVVNILLKQILESWISADDALMD
jgi:hypothetical protein